MSARNRKSRRGQATIELALVLLPMVAILAGTFEAARALWQYQALAAAVKSATRYIAVRGEGCAEASVSCGNTIRDVVAATTRMGVGLDASKLDLTLESASGPRSCLPAPSCAQDGTAWPESTANKMGQWVTIRAKYRFESVLWPPAKLPLTAVSRDTIQF